MTPCCGQAESTGMTEELEAPPVTIAPQRPDGSGSCVAVIQARLDSERLSGKVLMAMAGKPMLQHVIDRARQIQGVDDVLVAVATVNDKIQIEAMTTGARVCYYPEIKPTDVLARFAAVAKQFENSHSVYMRLTADCPMLDPAIAARVLQLYRSGGVDLCTNVTDGYQDGTDAEVFSRDALDLAHSEATHDWDREHVTPWLIQHLRVGVLVPAMGASTRKLSVDTLEEFKYVKALLEADVV